MLAVCGGSHDNGNSSVIVSLDGSRLFVANAGNNSVSVFSVDRNGANPTPLATFALSPDGKYVVAAWVGKPDNSSVPGILGRTAAAPILFDAFARISEKRAPLQAMPANAVRGTNADLPAPLKRWRDPGDDPATGRFIEPPVLISFPPDQSEIEEADLGGDPLVLKADGGALPLTWLIDGTPIKSEAHSREATWQPESAGFAKLTVIDAKGRTDRVSIRLR